MDSIQVQRLVLPVLLFAAGCVTHSDDRASGSRGSEGQASEAPFALETPAWGWPTEFKTAAVLVADEVTIEGPQGLLNHFVGLQSSAIEYSTSVTTRGLEQRFVVKVPGDEVARASLDGWEIAAQRRLVAIERPDQDGPVRVEASGQASWQRADGTDRREHPTMVFTAHPVPPQP